MSNDNTDTPKIWVSCLAAYNSGKLHGQWIDAAQDPSDIWAEINQILVESPVPDAEEHAIHDYEGFQGIRIGEYESIERVAEIAQLVTKYGSAYAAYVEYFGVDDVSAEEFEENYCGCYESEEDFAYQLWDDCGYLKKLEEVGINESYIDFERVATDLFIDSYLSVKIGYKEVHVFHRS